MMELKADTTIVVLGASGDLAKKKTVRFPRVSTIALLFLASFLVSVPVRIRS
jgi:hypothetical protein